jgi:hypothetical protein
MITSGLVSRRGGVAGMALRFSSGTPWGLVEMIVLSTRRDRQVLDDKSLTVMVSLVMTTLQ